MRASRRVFTTVLAVLSLAASACTSPAPPAPRNSPGPSDPSPSAAASPDVPRQPSRITDVNCDGVVDLVLGSVTQQGGDSDTWRAGSVTVRYGGSDLVQVVDQLAFGDGPSVYAGRFGGSVVAGDLNSDGCSDVVVGDAEAEDGATSPVWALWGSPDGISVDRSAVLISGQSGLGYQLAFVPLPSPVLVVGSNEGPRLYPVNADGTLGAFRLLALKSRTKPERFPDDRYGEALSASGDLLVVSSPQFDDEGYGYGGEVWVVRLLAGLRHEATWVGQDFPGVPGSYRLGDGFGSSVSLFHGYLAIGVPGAAVAAGSGRVHVFRVTGTRGPPRVRYLTTIDARTAGVPGARSRLFGLNVLVYRPCDDTYGVLVQAGFENDESSSAFSVPFSRTRECRAVVLARALTGWTPIGVSRRSLEGTAPDSALVVTTAPELRIVHASTTTGVPLDTAPFTVLAPPAA